MTSNGHQSGKPLRTGDPRELDGYRIMSRLGRGGMGTVYLAKDVSDRPVAVKLIHPDLADDESFRLRFAREVESARRVARFSTAGVIDARLEGEPLFIVSEYVPGPNLDEAIRSDGPMAGGTLDSLAMGVAAALTAIHGSGVIHRDLKPANVLLSPVGPKVIDFGIARALDDAGGAVTRSSQLMGTPSYMAPELILGRQATAAADIFAWGCLVAFAGTSSAPFDAATVPAVLHNISSAPPRLDGLDPSLYGLVSAALDKQPENRPTAKQLLARLTGQEEPEEAEVRRSISTSWAPPSGTPVSNLPPQVTEQQAQEAAAYRAPSGPQQGPGTPPDGRFTQTQGPQYQYPGQHPGSQPTRVPPTIHQYGGQGFPPSGPQQGVGQGGYPPQPPGQARGQEQQLPGYHGQSGGHFPVGPTHSGHPSPSHGQPAFATHSGPGGPGVPGQPPGHPGGVPGGVPPKGRHNRVLVIGAAVGAVLLAGSIGGVFLLNSADAIPENTVSLYSPDFSSDPNWVSNTYEAGESDGYWAEQRGVLLQLDPEVQPSRGEVVALGGEEDLPESVLVSTTAYVAQGPEQAMFGVRCWDNDGEEHRTQYEALLRYDGQGAQIRRIHEAQGNRVIAETADVRGYKPYPLFEESVRDEYGYEAGRDPYDFDADNVPTNTVTLSCNYVEDESGNESMELSMWVNGDHALTKVDDNPLPQDAEDTEDRRRVGIVTRNELGNEPLGVLFTEFSLHEIIVEE